MIGIKLYKIIHWRNIYIPPRFWFAVCTNFLKLFIFKCRLNRTFNTWLTTQQMELTAVPSNKTGSKVMLICFVLTELFVKILTTKFFDMFHFLPLAFDYRHWEFSGLVTVSPSECKAMLSDKHHSLFWSPYLLTFKIIALFDSTSLMFFFVFSAVLLLNDLGARFIHLSKHVTHFNLIINSIYIHQIIFRNETFGLKKSLTSTSHIVSVLPGKKKLHTETQKMQQQYEYKREAASMLHTAKQIHGAIKKVNCLKLHKIGQVYNFSWFTTVGLDLLLFFFILLYTITICVAFWSVKCSITERFVLRSVGESKTRSHLRINP